MVIIKPFLFVRFVFGSEILAREKRDERMKGGEEAEVPNDMNKKNIDKMSTANNIYFPCSVWDVSLHKGLHKDNKITSFLTLSPLPLSFPPTPQTPQSQILTPSLSHDLRKGVHLLSVDLLSIAPVKLLDLVRKSKLILRDDLSHCFGHPLDLKVNALDSRPLASIIGKLLDTVHATRDAPHNVLSPVDAAVRLTLILQEQPTSEATN